jgi:type I restriction enzyme S subunit
MSVERLITEHFDLWTSAVTYNRDEPELTGIQTLRELILKLAVRGRLVSQDCEEEPAHLLLERVRQQRDRLYNEGEIKKSNALPNLEEHETPYNLPKGWQWVRFGEIAHPQPGFAFKSSNFNKVGSGLPVIRIRDVGQAFSQTYYDGDYSEEYLVEDGEYLVSMDGIFRVAQWKGETALLNQRVSRLIFFSNELSKPFLCRALQMELEALQGTKSYTTVDHLSGKQISQSLVPLPPATEQWRIAQRLDELMALCDRLEQQTHDQLEAHETLVDSLLEALTQSANPNELSENWARLAEHFDTLFTTERSIEQLEQAVLKLAVTGRLSHQDEQGESASRRLERLGVDKQARGSEADSLEPETEARSQRKQRGAALPPTWGTRPFGDLLDFQGGSQPPKREFTDTPRDGYVRLLQIRDLGDAPQPVYVPRHSVSKFCNEQDILVGRYGASVGKVFWGEEGAYNVALVKIQNKKQVYSQQFLYYLLKSPLGQSLFVGINRSAQNGFKKSDIASRALPVPPIKEQKRIAAKVEELIQVCRNLKSTLNHTGRVKNHLADSLITRVIQ